MNGTEKEFIQNTVSKKYKREVVNMGFSLIFGKNKIFSWVKKNSQNINSILDIGPGQGTYFDLLSSLKPFNWTGIEAWNDYIKKFKLEEKYNKIYNQDVRNFDWSDKFFDLIIAGDVLEHMTKEEAIILVDKCLEHSNQLIISIPIIYMPQDELEGNPFEVHVKPDWSNEEIHATWGKHIRASNCIKCIGVYLLSKNI